MPIILPPSKSGITLPPAGFAGLPTSVPRGTEDTLALRLGGQQPQVDLNTVISNGLPAFARAGLGETSYGLAQQIAGKPLATEKEREALSPVERVAAIGIGFVADPVTYVSFGIGGQIAKQAVKKVALKTASTAIQRGVKKGVTTGVGFGLQEAVKEPLAAKAEGRDVDLGKVVGQTVVGTVAGAAGGAASVFGKLAGAGAEGLAFGVTQPAVEGRTPTATDFIAAAGMTVGVESAQVVGKGLYKLARGLNLSVKERVALRKVQAQDRVKVAEAAAERFDTEVAPKIQAIKDEARAKAESSIPDIPGQSIGETREEFITRQLAEQRVVTQEQAVELGKKAAGAFDKANAETFKYALIGEQGSKEEFASRQFRRFAQAKRDNAIREVMSKVRVMSEKDKNKFIAEAGVQYDKMVKESAPRSLEAQRAEMAERIAAPRLRSLMAEREKTQRMAVADIPQKGTLVKTTDEIKVPYGRKIKTFLAENFLSEGGLPPDVFRRRIEAEGYLSSQAARLDFTLRDFNKAVKAHYGGREKMSELDESLINGFLDGTVKKDALPSRLQPIMEKMRNEIDVLTDRMVKNGLAEGDLKITFVANKGHYVTRGYQVFDDKNWKYKVEPEVKNRAISWVRREFPELTTRKQIDGKINELLDVGKEDTPLSIIAKAKIRSKDLSITKHREDVPVELRELWGEYKNPMVRYAMTVDKMSKLIANHEFLTDIAKAGESRFFYKEPTGDFFRKIAPDESQTYKPLNGLYTTPEIADAFKAYTMDQYAPSLLRRLNTLAKFSKTVGSPITHVRNFVSNTGFAVAQGYWRVNKLSDAFQVTATDLLKLDKQAFRDRVEMLRGLGVIHESVRAEELESLFRDVAKGGIESYLDKWHIRMGKAVVRGAIKTYRAEDDFWKVFSFENEFARYKKAYGDIWTSEQITQKAADNVRRVMPTYSTIPKFIKELRRNVLIAPFVSFPYEVGRTAINTIRLMAEEMADPRTRAIGAERLAGISTIIAVTAGTPIAVRYLNGIDKQEDDDNRRFMPPWSQHSQIIYGGRDDQDRRKYIDMSYTTPYAYIRDPVIAFMRGEDFAAAATNSALELMAPFIGEELFAAAAIDLAGNRDRTSGRPIWNDEWDATDKFVAAIDHVWSKALEPGAVTSGKRIFKAATDYVDPDTEQTYDLTKEALAISTGTRRSEVDVKRSLGFKSRAFNRRMMDTESIVRNQVTRFGEVTEQQIKESFDETEQKRKERFNEFMDDVQAARRLGMDEDAVKSTLRSGGLSYQDADDVITGTYRPFSPSVSFQQSAIRKATGSKTVPVDTMQARLAYLRNLSQGQTNK